MLKPLEADEVREVALRLKAKLEQKQGLHSLALDLEAADSVEQAAAQLQRLLPAGQTCFGGIRKSLPPFRPAGAASLWSSPAAPPASAGPLPKSRPPCPAPAGGASPGGTPPLWVT